MAFQCVLWFDRRSGSEARPVLGVDSVVVLSDEVECKELDGFPVDFFWGKRGWMGSEEGSFWVGRVVVVALGADGVGTEGR